MLRIAVIDDDPNDAEQFARWIRSAKKDARIDIWRTREDAASAVHREHYDLITVDLDMDKDRHAGIAVIDANTAGNKAPVLVISAAEDPGLYKSITKAQNAWDYLEKPVPEAVFIETFLAIVRASQQQTPQVPGLTLDPLRRSDVVWKGKRFRLRLGALRVLNSLYERPNTTVTLSELFAVVKTGATNENVRKTISEIKAGFRSVDPDFDCIETVPMKGYRWVHREGSRS